MWCNSKSSLVRSAIALGALRAGGPLSSVEQNLAVRVSGGPAVRRSELRDVRERVAAGDDPFGEALRSLRSPLERRMLGQFFTPKQTVDVMVDWAISEGAKRFIDPGCGTGRFTQAAILRNRRAEVIAIDLDPIATLCTRAVLACLDARSATVIRADYLSLCVPNYSGKTAYVGNPPYLRHNQISSRSKSNAAKLAADLGYKVSGVPGLHALFFLATARNAKSGDIGCYITSAEWLDVNYGSLVRKLLLNGLGGRRIWMLDPKGMHFHQTQTTTAISFFEIGSRKRTLEFRTIEPGPTLTPGASNGIRISFPLLSRADKWSPFARVGWNERSEMGRLGEIARVHRGQATGANRYFVLTKERAKELHILQWCRPAVTSAAEIISSKGVIRDTAERLVVLDAPADVDRKKYPALDAYLKLGEKPREDKPPVAAGYLASHRRPWWKVNVPAPPIVATYMARSAPVFAINPDGLGLLNIGHGLYPIKAMSKALLEQFVKALNANRADFAGFGRTYHGGLEKFEPREMEALPFEFSLP